MTVLVMRAPCLPQDEGRHVVERSFHTKAEAVAWIVAQDGEYFGPGDYYTVTVPEPQQ